MRVMQTVETSKGLTLQEAERPTPTPGREEILLRVHAAGVITTELTWSPTTRHADGSTRKHAIPTHEFSGEVVTVSEGVNGFTAGQSVYGMNDWYQEGALAEFCVAPASSLAAKPKSLSHEQAASVPISALTAWQGLTTHGHLQAGERVLIHGGSGGVGLFAVQFAKSIGAHVIATTSAATVQLVKELGADQVLDYRNSRFDQQLRDIDLVMDTVGGDTLERSWNVLSPTGRLVTAASDIKPDAPQRTKDTFFLVQPDGQRLADIAVLLDASQLRTFVKAVTPFNNAARAYDHTLPSPLPYGKIVVSILEK
jgi:NADPH:quinone reductase-like Zn-dependent oxidoreductase